MKLSQLSAAPKLIKIVLEGEEILKEFNESLEFWIYDRQPMDKFVKMATMKSENFAEMVELVNGMVLDENGERIITGEKVLPTHIMTSVIGKVVETLGK